MPRHRFRGRAASLDKFPELNPKILATATYHDAFIQHPERLCLDLILDGEAANPEARALNYCPVSGIEDGGVILEHHAGGGRFRVEPAVVINAAGPWIDRANGLLGRETGFIGGTKGSHIVLDHSELREAVGENERLGAEHAPVEQGLKNRGIGLEAGGHHQRRRLLLERGKFRLQPAEQGQIAGDETRCARTRRIRCSAICRRPRPKRSGSGWSTC